MRISLDFKVQMLENHEVHHQLSGSQPQGCKPWVHRTDRSLFEEAQSQDQRWAFMANLS